MPFLFRCPPKLCEGNRRDSVVSKLTLRLLVWHRRRGACAHDRRADCDEVRSSDERLLCRDFRCSRRLLCQERTLDVALSTADIFETTWIDEYEWGAWPKIIQSQGLISDFTELFTLLASIRISN